MKGSESFIKSRPDLPLLFSNIFRAGTSDALEAIEHQSNLTMMRFPRPGCWFRFTDVDWKFIFETLALTDRGRDGLASLCEDPETISLILDHPKLLDSLLQRQSLAMLSPELFFFLIVRHTLKRVGITEVALADYIAVVCADFGCRPSLERHEAERQVESFYSIDYVKSIDQASRHERFFLHVQCANQFLILTSLYPDYLKRRTERRGAPGLDYYESIVVSHFHAAGRHVLAEEFAMNEVLTHLADAFPPVRRAMNHTVREYLHLGQ